MPKVSVLLPIYNAERYLQETLDSLFAQTFTDFEIIAVDDGSSDASIKILKNNTDSRLKVVSNEKNLGISDTLNRAISIATGQYLARMDADDIAYPSRFEKQVAYLDSHPEVDVLGTWFRLFGGTVPQVIENPVDHAGIQAALIFDSALGHPTVMIRASSLTKVTHAYDAKFNKAEDYEFWTRGSNQLVYANLPEVLLDYRIHRQQTGSTSTSAQTRLADQVRLAYLEQLGIRLSDPSKQIHLELAHYQFGKMRVHDFMKVDTYLKEMTDYLRETPTLKIALLKEFERYFTHHFYRDYFNQPSKHFIRERNLFNPSRVSLNKKIFWISRSLREPLIRILRPVRKFFKS